MSLIYWGIKMKLCPWCNTEYPEEFFEVHHINHIHEDDSPENRITICVKCHKRHHRESGYDTVIIKKNSFVPKTLMEEMISIERIVFLQEYRKYAENKIDYVLSKELLTEGFGIENRSKKQNEKCKILLEWIKKDSESTLDIIVPDNSFSFRRCDDKDKKE
jgi:hypothetical protein